MVFLMSLVAQQFVLDDVPRGLGGCAAGPALGGMVEARAAPPVGIYARQMAGGLVGASQVLPMRLAAMNSRSLYCAPAWKNSMCLG